MKKIRNFILLIIIIFVVIAGHWFRGLSAVSNDRTKIAVAIKKGANASQVADALYDKGLIRNRLLFRTASKLNGSSGKFQPGRYMLNRSLSAQEIMQRLVSGKTDACWVTFPEGYTARQIGDKFEEKTLINGEDFVRITIFGGFPAHKFSFIYGRNLEGYLFPDTYMIDAGAKPDEATAIMLQAFDAKVISKYKTQIQEIARKKFNIGTERFPEGLYKVLTVASLVEREARIASDRPLIASVIYNRLKKNIRLEMCATVSYIPGESRQNKSKIFTKDTLVDSPYNTYRNYGLPPSPICNPGLESIKAAINPASTEYLYYVARKDGSHIFSKTYSQHLAAKRSVN